MANFNANDIIQFLRTLSDEEKKKKSSHFSLIGTQIDNVMLDLKITLKNQSAEDTTKYILWQGLLNQYGIFGSKRDQKRTFCNGTKDYYSQLYSHGDLLSIDFGTSNLGIEFAFTHTAIVVADYTDYVIVLPTTSCKDGRLESKPEDEIDDTLVITDKDFKDIECDSFILLYQIRSVSKNRITKYIGNISSTSLMKEIDEQLAQIITPIKLDEYNNIVDAYKKEIDECKKQLKDLKEKLEKSEKDN